MKERRRETRILEENRVVIEVVAPSGGPGTRSFNALTQDLSLGGARVLCEHPFNPGVEVGMTIILSKSRQIVRIRGRVRWARETEPGLYEAGVEFQHQIPGSVLSLINHLYKKNTGVPTTILR
jgi:hypothetical protein